MPIVTLSHYELLDRIAEGGMGVVYKARDTRLERLVALKLVSPASRCSSEEVERLFQEARAISQLNHPNVATVYEVDQHGREPFMAMEFLPGGTLRTKLGKLRDGGGRLEPKQIVDYALQTAKGLAHAHRHGIIHRDIKADNVLFTADGEAKLTDFGVARIAGEQTEDSTLTLGTVAYLSPEQAQGHASDHRADIFSFGVLLYEMAAGQVPFTGDREELILYDLVHTPAPPLQKKRGDLPAGFHKVIRKALEKNPEDRYQSMDDVLRDLRAVSKELSMADTRTLRVQTPDPTIAVLPFVDMSPEKDQEYFCDGITEEIINALTAVKGLKVVSRTSSFRFKEAAYDIREIGQQLGVKTVVEGSVRRLGSRFRITAQHIDVASGYHLWSQRFDREMADVFKVQDEIAQAIVENLREHLAGDVPKQIVKERTENIEAYNLYLQGRFYLNQRSLAAIRQSVECFKKAACEDFALPCAGLAEAAVLLGSGGFQGEDAEKWLATARQAAEEAIERDSSCAEAHVALALVCYRVDWNWEKAEEEFRQALAINDGYATGHHQYGLFLASLRRFDEALDEARKAHELDPLSPIISTAVGRVLDFSGRYPEAVAQCEKTVRLNPQFAGGYFDLGIAHMHNGDFERGEEALRKMSELSGEGGREAIVVAILRALQGRKEEALAIVEQATASAQEQPAPFGLSVLYGYLGEVDKAFELLEQSYSQKDPMLVYLQAERSLEPIRQDPRYRSLVERMGFPAPQAVS